MLARTKAVLILLSLAPAAFAQTINGTVVDGDSRVIAGARVTSTCGQQSKTSTTDPQGRFEFRWGTAAVEACSLEVSSPGFQAFKQLVGPSRSPHLIRMDPAPIREAVNVDARLENALLDNVVSLGSRSLSDAELQRISNNTYDLIRYAKAAAGATFGQDALYIDGLPASVAPPSTAIGRITVNSDPFSSEFSDIGQNRIEITTKGPDRRLRFHLAAASLSAGASNVLAPGLDSISRTSSLGLSGPVPGLPASFSARASVSQEKQVQPIQAVVPRQHLPRAAFTDSRAESVSLTSYYSRSETVRANFSLSQLRDRSANINVGGLTLPEAGMSGSAGFLEVRAASSIEEAPYQPRRLRHR